MTMNHDAYEDDIVRSNKTDGHFSLGQYVLSASEPTGQVGLVADLNISVDLLAPDGTFRKDISTKKLKRVRDFFIGDYVVHVTVPSLGRVEEARENVFVKLDDGSTRFFKEVDPTRLLPVQVNNFGVDANFPFHIGQRVIAIKNRLEGTVKSITSGPVCVNWIASAGVGPDSSVPLVDWQSSNVLALLSSSIHAKWKLGDWCNIEEESSEGALLIVDSRTLVDVAWQDGTVECRREATTLIPTQTPGDDVFVAEQYVVEKAIDDDGDGNTTEPKRVGVVKSLDAKERMAIVRWLKPLQRAEEPRQFESEGTVSVCELERHPDYDYYTYGDVVVRLSPSPGDSLEETKEQGNDTKHHQQDEVNANLSWFGNITGLKDGDFEVTWADGMVSKVGPGAVYVVEQPDAAGSGVSTRSDSSWEEDIGRGSFIEGNSDAVTLPLANHIECDNQAESTNPSGEKDDPSPQSFVATDNCQSEGPVLENEALEGSKSGKSDETVVTSEGDSYSFSRFDISQEPLDHHYVGKEEQKIKERVWVKKVNGDWKILQDNLPDEIFVRVYEDRMDLMRAVILGPHGTPYQDGLFFYDIHLPPKYPSEPPLVYYHSGGWKLNPNLYENGNICLSLLNTWQGRGSEVWNPKSSSILQVLVSLQGLVLNAKPYFNEAGYDLLVGSVEGEKRSLEYNEDAFLRNCKTMMHLMKNQPKACNAYMEGCLIGSLTKDASIADSTSKGFKLSLEKIIAKLLPAITGLSDQ